MKTLYVYCWRTGEIQFRTRPRHNCITIGKGPADKVRAVINAISRQSYPSKPGRKDCVPLVPGLYKSTDSNSALDVVCRFRKEFEKRMQPISFTDGPFEVIPCSSGTLGDGEGETERLLQIVVQHDPKVNMPRATIAEIKLDERERDYREPPPLIGRLISEEEKLHNAQLFATATETLACLEEMLRLDHWEDDSIAPKALIRRAREAVKNAKTLPPELVKKVAEFFKLAKPERKRPISKSTLKRVSAGVKRFKVNPKTPFLVPLGPRRRKRTG